MNKILAFGDSFTWGSELEDAIVSLDVTYIWDIENINSSNLNKGHTILSSRKAGPFSEVDHNHKVLTAKDIGYSMNVWPALLAKHLDREYRCYATQGGSNQSITRKLIQYLPFVDEDDFVIINWTYIDRWDFVNDNLPIEKQWNTIRPTSENKTNFEKFYFKYIRSELWNKWNSLKEIMLASNILQNKNIKFMMTCADNLILDDIYHTPSYVKNAQDEIKDNIIWFDGKGFNDWCTEHKFPRGKKNDHPLEEAHIAAFEYIKDNHDFTK